MQVEVRINDRSLLVRGRSARMVLAIAVGQVVYNAIRSGWVRLDLGQREDDVRVAVYSTQPSLDERLQEISG